MCVAPFRQQISPPPTPFPPITLRRTIREVWDTQSVEDLAFQPFVAMAAHSMLWAMYASMIRDIGQWPLAFSR